MISKIAIINYNNIKKPISVNTYEGNKKPKSLNTSETELLPLKDIKTFIQTRDKLVNLRQFYSQIFHQNKDMKAMQLFDQKVDDLGFDYEGI